MTIPIIPRRRSRTPQSLPKSTQAKFKRLKQRLKMKVRVSDETTNPQPEDDMEEAQPVITESQPPQHEDALAPNLNAPQDEQVGQGNRIKSGLFNRASPMKMFRVCKGFTPEQRKVIINADLGDVLHWKCNKLIPELCKFLMGCFNPDTCELDFGSRGRIPTDMKSVVRVLGVPMGSIPISYCLDAGATRTMLEMFDIKDGKQPSLAFLEKQLGAAHPANHIFLRKFCIYLTCAVFAPTTAIGISPRCYPSLVNTKAIRNLNWPQFIIDIIIQTARAKGTKNWFKACMPSLMILYVDALDLDSELEVPEEGTRICVWTNKLVKLAVDLDTNIDGSFGKLPLKHCFRIKMTLFSAGPSVLDVFIKTHAPGDHTEDDMAKYRTTITDMCTVFEDGIAKFLKNLSSLSKSQPLEVDRIPEGEQLIAAQHNIRTRERTSKCTTEKTDKLVLREGKVATRMGLKIDTDESRVMQEDNRKRKPPVESFQTVGGKSKKTKPNQLKEPEPPKPNEEEVQFEPDEKLGSEDTGNFDLDMEIATGQGVANRMNTNRFKSKSVLERGTSTVHVDSIVGALKQLEIYGSGSQSSADIAPEASIAKVTPDESMNACSKPTRDGIISQHQVKLATKEPTIGNVTFVEPNTQHVEPNRSPTSQSSPILRRPVTRSMSPLKPPSPICSEKAEVKWDVGSSGRSMSPLKPPYPICSEKAEVKWDVGSSGRSMSPLKPPYPVCSEKAEVKWDVGSSGIQLPSPKRQTRFATAKISASTFLNNQLRGSVVDQHGPAGPIQFDSTTRKLEHDFSRTELHSETEQHRRERQRRELIDDCPTFDLGFDDSPVTDVKAQEDLCCTKPVASEQQPVGIGLEEVPVIISSNESVDSLDEIFLNCPMPVVTPVNNRLKEPMTSPSAPNSYTPVPQAHQKRVVKTAPAQMSPFMTTKKKPVASKLTCDVYNKVCTFGGRTKDQRNGEKIIDVGCWFIYLADLANSIKPNGLISNSTCETALYILSKELACQRKCVMPLSIGTKLRSPNFIQDRSLHKAFEFSDKNRLDHKELLMFSILQDLTPMTDKFTGHYYLISVNLKAERFEVMDSLRSVGTPSLSADSWIIIDAIKQMWSVNYHQSNVDITTFPTVFIATPMQKTLHDCGYFMLKYIEEWDGRRMVHPFSHVDMPISRKLFMIKWLEWEENIIAWNDLLFKNKRDQK